MHHSPQAGHREGEWLLHRLGGPNNRVLSQILDIAALLLSCREAIILVYAGKIASTRVPATGGFLQAPVPSNTCPRAAMATAPFDCCKLPEQPNITLSYNLAWPPPPRKRPACCCHIEASWQKHVLLTSCSVGRHRNHSRSPNKYEGQEMFASIDGRGRIAYILRQI